MIGILGKVTFFVLILTILVLVGRGVWQLKNLSLPKIFYPLNYLGLLIFIFGLVLQERSFLDYSSIAIAKAGLGLSIFSLFAICSMSTIEKITRKKVKTLIRIPIIGLLLAIYLTPIHFAIAVFIIEMIQYFLFFKFKNSQRYCYRQQSKAIFGMLLAMFLYYNQTWMFYLGLTIYFVMKFQISNGVKLKLLINEKTAEC